MSSPEEEFRLLMARVRAGCPDAAREVYKRYGGHIRRVVRRRMHDGLRPQHDSIDFMQDVWVSFFTTPWEKYTFDTPEELVSFLSEVAYLKVAQAFRRRFQTKKHNVQIQEPLEGQVGDDKPASDPPARGPSPSQVAIANEYWERLIQGQPEPFRLMLELLRLGHTYKEVAERTGLHPKMIQRVLYKMAQQRDFQ